MPCYNAKDTLRLSLGQLEKQTIGMDSLEIILVDDASIDGGATLNILKEFEEKYPESVILIPLEKNVRQGGARNIALQYASGKYVAYCDADDWLALDAYKQLYELAEKHSADVVEFDYKYVIDTSEIEKLVSIQDEPVVTRIVSVDDRKRFIMGDMTIICWNKLYKTSLLKDNEILFSEGIYNEEVRFSNMCRMLESVHVQTDAVFYYYYKNADSVTNKNTYEERIPDVLKAYEDFLLRAKSDASLYETYIDEIEFTFWTGYFLLPLICKAQDNATFYTRTELLAVSNFVKSNISKISENKYFMEKFSDAPFIGDLAFWDLSQIDLNELRDIFNGLDLEV